MGRQAEITDLGINGWTGGGPDRNPVPGRDENAPVHLQNQGNRQSGWTGAGGTENESKISSRNDENRRSENRKKEFLVFGYLKIY